METSVGGTNFGMVAEAQIACMSVDDIIRAAKAAGVKLTDSDVVAIVCAQGPGNRWGACLPMPVIAKDLR